MHLRLQAVALQGPYKGFQLKQADLTCASLAELSIWNVRRLFALRCRFLPQPHLGEQITTAGAAYIPRVSRLQQLRSSRRWLGLLWLEATESNLRQCYTFCTCMICTYLAHYLTWPGYRCV